MILIGSLPLAGAFAYSMLQPARYQTAAAVFVDTQMPQSSRGDSGDSGVISGQLRLATSKTVLQRAIEKEQFVDDATFMARPTGLVALAKSLLGLVRNDEQGQPASDRPAAVLALVSQSVQARRGEGANMIEVSATTDDAASAMRIANAVAQSFVEEIVAMADQTQGSERSRLSRRGDDLKARLAAAENALIAYRAQNGLEGAPVRAPAVDADGPGQIARARAATLEAKARYDLIQKLMASGKEAEAVADVVRSPSIDRLRIQYNEAAAQEASFRSSLGPRHPAYLEAQQQAREKKRLLQEGLRLAASSARVDWQVAREQEAALESRPGAPATVAAPSQRPMQLQELERNAEIARAAYDRFVRSFDTPETAAQSVAARVVALAPLPMQAMAGEGRKAWTAALVASVAIAALIGLAGIVRDMGRPAPGKAPTVRMQPAVRAAQPADEEDSPSVAESTPDEAPPAVAPASTTRRDPVDSIARYIAERNEEFPLQTVLVLGQDPTCKTTDLAIALARAARGYDLRVLVIDADDASARLSREWAYGPNAGIVTIQSHERRAVTVDCDTPTSFCLIPAETALAPVQPGVLKRIGGIAGNFDLVILHGPAMSGALTERKLARASQCVVVGYCGERPGQIRLSQLLDAPVESIRLVAVASAPPESRSPVEQSPVQPMSIVRLKRCA